MLFLAQTDTTAGFLSKDFREINKAKNRALQTPCILTMAYFSELLSLVRVPKLHKNLVRKARKTSFVYANSSPLRALNDENSNLKAISKNLNDKNLILNAKNPCDFKGNLACRVVKDSPHSEFLAKNGAFFSSSANLHEAKFNAEIARQITLENNGKIIDERLFEGKPSRLILLSKTKKRKIR